MTDQNPTQTEPNQRHALIRTSPKGGPFIGDCLNCEGPA